MHPIFNTAVWETVLACWKPKFILNHLSPAEEELLIQISRRHRIAPLLYQQLKNASGVSEETKKMIKEHALANHVEVLRIKNFLHQFHAFITSSGHAYLLLKGLGIGQQYYNDAGLRSSVDIDLWIETAGIQPVFNWLVKLGYRSEADLLKLNPRQTNYLIRSNHGMGFVTELDHLPPLIEIHTCIASHYGSYAFDPIRQRRHFLNINLGASIFPVMDHDDQFLYLCVHGTEHAWFRLKWLFDLPIMMHKIQFDWEALRRKAVYMNCLPHLELSMLLVRDLFGVKLPEPIFSRLDSQKYRSQLSYIYNSIEEIYGVNDSDWFRFRHLIYNISLQGRIPPASFFMRYLTGPSDWIMVRLPEHLFFIYFLLRPLLWMQRRLVAFFNYLTIKK